jgi:hypothetical protein
MFGPDSRLSIIIGYQLTRSAAREGILTHSSGHIAGLMLRTFSNAYSTTLADSKSIGNYSGKNGLDHNKKSTAVMVKSNRGGNSCEAIL